MSLLRYLGFGGEPERNLQAETDSVRKIAEALDRLEPNRAKLVAAFAYVLGRVAASDLRVVETETRQMERLVGERMGLPEAQAVLAVQIAKTQNKLFGATEDFLVTRELNSLASREQKIKLLDCLFAVAAADGSVSTAEDNEIRRISIELRLSHRDYIDSRSAYRAVLAVLNPPDPSPAGGGR